MEEKYLSLRHMSLLANTSFYHRQRRPEFLHLDHPAMDAMVDFRHDNPPIVRPRLLIDEALKEITIIGLPVLLVVDKQDIILGVVTSKDIQGAKPIDISQKLRIRHDEITVEQVMTPWPECHAIVRGSLTNAQVGHIVQTFKTLQCQFLLVVEMDDANDEKMTVIGLISRSLLSRQLHTDLAGHLAESSSLVDLQGKIRK